MEAELARYKSSVEELNRQTGSHIDPAADPNDLMKQSTRSLMSAVSSLPGKCLPTPPVPATHQRLPALHAARLHQP